MTEVASEAVTSPPSRKRKLQSKKSNTTVYSTLPLPPCKVCGGQATGYHFGVITCEACKAFFRRALIHKQDYHCLRDNVCDVMDRKLGGNCSACRLRKCFGVGMSKRGVIRGRYTIARRTKSILEAKALEGKDAGVMAPSKSPEDPTNSCVGSPIISISSSDMSDEPLDLSPRSAVDIGNRDLPATGVQSQSYSPSNPSFTREFELELLIDAVMSCQDAVYPNLKRLIDFRPLQYQTYEELKVKRMLFGQHFGRLSVVTTEEYQQIFAETGIDVDDRLAQFNEKGRIMEDQIAEYVNFIKLIPGIKNINPKDVSKLIKAAHMEFWVFGNYMLYNKELEIAVSWDGSHTTTKENMAKFIQKDWADALFRFSDSLQKLQLSVEEIALIRLIVLTFTDRCQIEDNSKVNALQEEFVECLRYQVSKTYKNPDQRLAKIIDRMLAIRDITHLNASTNAKFIDQWGFLIHDYPLWKEMLTFDEI